MENNKRGLEVFVEAERCESADERATLLDCNQMMSVDDATKVLTELRVPTSRNRRELKEDLSQIALDASVVSQVSKMGGDLERTREVRHWAYFKRSRAAQKFAQFVANAGYSRAFGVVIDESLHGREFRVRFTHEGSLQLNSVAGHSVRLRRLAAVLKGTYDGWEVTLSRDESSESSRAVPWPN